MKKTAIKLILLLVMTTLIISCSTKKDRFLNRAMHATATKYNVLYNGKVAYKAAKKQLDDNYEDNFFEVLPIEPLKIEEKIMPPVSLRTRPSTNNATSTASNFTKAEEKAVKAVQKHSMNIGGKEKNKQIDDAYFLLGKSRYYDQRFVPALETFAYIIKHYPSSPLFNQARIWEAKCFLRLKNEEEAKDKLNLVLELKETPDQIKADALTALAMVYTQQDSTQMVIDLLDSTMLYKTKNYNQKARNLFILGQLYRQNQKIDSSNLAFEQLNNYKKAPYRFKIYSQIERAKNYNKETDSTAQVVQGLVKLSKNRDNRPFLDAIYFQLGKIDLVNDNIESATDYFKQAIRTKKVHKQLKSMAYEEIGNIKFDKADFLMAGSYYDSVLNLAENKNTKRIVRLARKRKSLNQVIQLENSTKRNDSILKLASMSKEAQTNFFNTYINALKKKDEEERIIAQNKKSGGFGESLLNIGSKQSSKAGTFYFYNPQTVGFGESEFKKIWGERELVDNWRLSDKKIRLNTEDNQAEVKAVIDETKKYDVAYYLSKIPVDEKELDSLSKQRNNAYYKLGLIYKEKFKKDQLATKRLEKLLTFVPKEKLVLPTYYHLYKAFESFNMTKSDFYKNKITSNFADSRYAQLINNPAKVIDESTDENSPTKAYETTYKNYLNKNYSQVLTSCNKYINTFEGENIVPKFELLKAYAIAKMNGKDAFIKALTFVKTNYPNLEEGIHAANVLASLSGKKVVEKKTDSKKMIKKIKTQKELPSSKKMLDLIKKKKKSLGPPGK